MIFGYNETPQRLRVFDRHMLEEYSEVRVFRGNKKFFSYKNDYNYKIFVF
jgi:hypothetical protein